MPVIVESDPGTVSALSALLPRGAHAVDDADRLHAWLAHRHDEYAVLLGPTLDLADATVIAEGLRLTRPTTSVILLRKEYDAEVLHRAMQAGCRDVVRTEDAAGIGAAVGRAQQLWQALHGSAAGTAQGHVVTVFSPKGGVGKTTTAVNLALALADGGARKVCLVDLDLAFGDVAITMQLFPSHTIEEAIGGEEMLDASMVEELLTRHEQGIMVLAAPNLPDARDRITALLVGRILKALRQTYDYVVVDTAPSFDEQTLQALDETDECLIVATLDVPTLKNVKVAIETMDLLSVAVGHRHLVLNRADDAVGLDDTKVEAILGMGITTAIPSSTEIAAATNAGRPIIVGNGDHPASRAYRALAGHLATAFGDSHPAAASDAAGDHERRGRRLFTRK
jgi:pilus assembly protein CpaE